VLVRFSRPFVLFDQSVEVERVQFTSVQDGYSGKGSLPGSRGGMFVFLIDALSFTSSSGRGSECSGCRTESLCPCCWRTRSSLRMSASYVTSVCRKPCKLNATSELGIAAEIDPDESLRSWPRPSVAPVRASTSASAMNPSARNAAVAFERPPGPHSPRVSSKSRRESTRVDPAEVCGLGVTLPRNSNVRSA